MERSIQGPTWDTDFGTAEQCAAYVGGIDRRIWLELDAAGLILPPAARRNRQSVWWHWHSAVYVRLALSPLLGRLRKLKRDEKKGKRKVRQTDPKSPPKGAPEPAE